MYEFKKSFKWAILFSANNWEDVKRSAVLEAPGGCKDWPVGLTKGRSPEIHN